MPHPRIIIVGGGFAGLSAARTLQHAAASVTLIDRRNHHLFQPLLYQVATAVLNPSEIAAPLRSILGRQANCRVLLGEVASIDASAKTINLEGETIGFDYLILATGAAHSYFGHDGWREHAPGLKSIEDALEMRRRMLLAFEKAEREPDAERRRAWLTFVIVGAGPTGVELAGALAEIARHTLKHEFRNIDPASARVMLVEGEPKVLPQYPDDLCARAARALARLGVEMRLATRVTEIDAEGISLGGERLAARTVLWAAGVAASSLGRSLGAVDRAGRVAVDATLAVAGRTDIFVVGDLAAVQNDGHLVPALAPAAMQQGRHAARNILRAMDSRPLLPFRYHHRGSFAVIGRGAAVGEIGGRLHASGFLAWAAWLFIHIFFLIGFRSRLLVLVQWAYSFLFTWRRGARLITHERC